MQLQALCITVAECLAGIHNAKFRGGFVDSIHPINYGSEYTGLGVDLACWELHGLPPAQDKGNVVRLYRGVCRRSSPLDDCQSVVRSVRFGYKAVF